MSRVFCTFLATEKYQKIAAPGAIKSSQIGKIYKLTAFKHINFLIRFDAFYKRHKEAGKTAKSVFIGGTSKLGEKGPALKAEAPDMPVRQAPGLRFASVYTRPIRVILLIDFSYYPT